MTRSLILATGLVAMVLIISAAALLLWSRADEGAEADRRDIAAVTAVAAVTTEPDSLRSAIARTAAGADGRIAVHLASGGTIGSGQAGHAEVAAVAAGASPLPPPWRVLPGRAVIELTERATEADSRTVREIALLMVIGVLACVAAVLVGRQRFSPLLKDMRTLADAARAGRTRVHATGPRELADLAEAVNGVADRTDLLLANEREMIADVSHRLRTPLTALRLDVDFLDDSVISNRIRSAVCALDRHVDQIIESLQPARSSGLAESDLAAVVRARMEFWCLCAADQGRWCEVNIPDRPSIDRCRWTLRRTSSLRRWTRCWTTSSSTPRKASPIAVEVVAHAGWITLAVEDGGPGVSAPDEAIL
jgi:hypothetical protein